MTKETIIKEGTITAQDNEGEWVPCHVLVKKQGITLTFNDTTTSSNGNTNTDKNNNNAEGTTNTNHSHLVHVMEFQDLNENQDPTKNVGITILPDHARRSRESKLFPFSVHLKSPSARQLTEEEESNGHISSYSLSYDDDEKSSIRQGTATTTITNITHRNEVILATSDGREMWEWATAIQWLGRTPNEESIPRINEPSTVANRDVHYQDSIALQNVLLKMFTYKNLPERPVTFEELARYDHERSEHQHDEDRHYYARYTRTLLSFVNFPNGFFDTARAVDESESEENDGDIEVKVEDDHLTYLTAIDEDATIDSTSSSKTIENHTHMFGLFAYVVLVGSCIHVNEKCFELITSSNLYDVSSQVTWKGNPILSMLCEGDYNCSRTYMVKSLWRLGYPTLDGYYAGFLDEAFAMLLTKPEHLWGCGSPTGQPVHPDDQKLCRLLRDKGDGKADNDLLTKQLIEASGKNEIEFSSEHGRRITAIHIPKSIINWGITRLTELDLSYNAISELPDELYDFTSLTSLDISQNCLFGLSHRLGNLKNLTKLNIGTNLITELPDTIEGLEHITDFDCAKNPITKPPSAVWSRGIGHIRNYFKDMRESGTEVNVDLRLLVLGLSEAGKTSLVNGLVNPDTKALTRVGDRTVGIEKRSWKMNREKDREPVNLLTYDFAGQEEYYITHHLFLGSRALYILAFDLYSYKADPNPKEALDKQIVLWWDSIQDRVCDTKSNESKTPKVIIVGTHADMLNDAQSAANDVHKSLKELLAFRTMGVSNRIKEIEKNLDKLDPRIRKKKDDKGESSELRKEAYEKLSADEKVQILSLENDLRKLQHQNSCTIALPEDIPAISSKDMCNFDKLKQQIASSLNETGPSGKYFPQLDEHLPRSWFQVRKFVRDQSTKKGRECMKLPQYFKLLSDELAINEDVARRATHFCHDLGDLLFFDKEGLVFLRPSFLIDVFKLVIRHDHKESTYWTEEMLKQNIEEDEFNIAKMLLLQKGVLEEWFLDLLWSQLDDDIEPDSSMKNNLIQLLETFDVATSIQHKGCPRLLIPEFQPQSMNGEWSEQKEDNEFEIRRWICVDQNLPRGLLKRLQVRLLKQHFKRNCDMDYFDLAQNEFCIFDKKNATKVYCARRKRSEKYPGQAESEGFLMCIRGEDEEHVSTILPKLYRCVEATLKDFPGKVFDQYEVDASKGTLSFTELDKVNKKENSDKNKIY